MKIPSSALLAALLSWPMTVGAQARDGGQAVAADVAPRSAIAHGDKGAKPSAQLVAAYATALRTRILSSWTRPASVPSGVRCLVRIRQLPGGEVVTVGVDPSCPYDDAAKRSVEAAVLKAQPLPYRGFEQVFTEQLLLSFVASDE
ncbi:TonB C-terminal domain-containing protein [Luteimonas aquatica]|uniref:TonB C-terminal domain-containing protein n=1 Tax=Luteimonas aquatica TaxID=450364 RepID=UPI003CE4FFF2